jgi:hypothetical protein
MQPVLLILLALAMSCPALAATYYVDSLQGEDSRSGTSQEAAWKSLERVNSMDFRPGDRILLKAGSVWQGQLAPKNSGSEGAPIRVDRYGAGRRPRIDGGGKVDDAVLLRNVQYIEMRNLEVTNQGETPGDRCGIHIFADNFGTAKHIVVAGMYVHDVNGTNQRKDVGGIIFRTNGDKTPSRFDGLRIEQNIVWKVDRSAIAAQSYHWPRRRWFPSLHVVIRDNFVEDIGGDGIVPWATDGAVVEHNIARHCNRRANAYNAGIWPWSTDNTLLQLNEAALTHTTLDGQGFDADYNSRHTLFQYNYSHDNEGGFMLICSPGQRDQDNVGNLGTIVRYNISRDDRARIFHLSAAVDTTVHDNAIYVWKTLDVQLLLTSSWQGWAEGAVFRNNTFYVEGVARYGHGVRKADDGKYAVEPGWGGAKAIVFEGNQYIGSHVNAPEDTKARRGSPAAPKLDWNGPQFDPARPDGFDTFLDTHRKWMTRLFEQQFGKPVRLGR